MKKIIVPVLVFLLSGCQSVPKIYLRADRNTFNAVAPEYKEYIQNDTTLSEAQKELRFNTIETWDRRIESAEQNLEAQQ